MNTGMAPWTALGLRSVAYATDVVILFAAVIASQLLLRPVNPLLGTARVSWQHHAWVAATVTLPVFLYFTLFFALGTHSTAGMRVFGLHVTTVTGLDLGLSRAMLRAAVLLVPFEVNHIVLFYPRPIWEPPAQGFRAGFLVVGILMTIYLALVPLTSSQQSIHDLAAGTIVRRIR